MAGMYAVYHGPDGLKKIASRVHGLTRLFAKVITEHGYHLVSESYFDTLKIRARFTKEAIHEMAEKAQINLRYFDDEFIGVSFDETTTLSDVQNLLDIFVEANHSKRHNLSEKPEDLSLNWDSKFVRTSSFLTHPVFNTYQSEHEMLRYIKRLEAKDLSLCHSMISLGSCTMKLNATAEMIPVTWPVFGALHPFAPSNQTLGYKDIIDELTRDLSAITGFHTMSLQPNAGSSRRIRRFNGYSRIF